MVFSPSKLFAVTVACLVAQEAMTVSAAPLEYNPVTNIEVDAPLCPSHPAFGAARRGDVVQPEVRADPNLELAVSLTIANSSAVELVNVTASADAAAAALVGAGAPKGRSLEASNADLAKLERHFGQPMERNLDTISKQYMRGEVNPTPWPASYWPIYQDSINYRWKQGEGSPAEKYARAFGQDVKTFMDRVSVNNGIDGWSNRKKCSADSECSGLRDGSRCAKREGRSSGYCIPGWFGICHAWAPASILEPEPKCDVVKNGVTFRPFDLKGLMTAVYDGVQLPTVFTGARFDGPDEPKNLDKYGRYQDAARRDIGAGYFHIALTNIMGKFKQSFVVDVTAGAEVWNQPVRSYQIVTSRIVDPSQASMQYFGTQTYPFNADMKRLAYVKTRFSYMVEAGEDGGLIPRRADAYTRTVEYEYFLELDANNNIVGGEWIGQSRYNHPDFLWFATSRPDANAVTKIGLSYKEVRALVDASAACGQPAPGPGPAPVPAPPTVRPAPVPAPVPGPAPVPQPQPQPTNGFCSMFSNRFSCTFWFWCQWNPNMQSCSKRMGW
ncbi:hypothetical protein PINS_up003369 [Pythium insidiosum]|nr:hypothetical protein PINS_up003369 [Pythium insidiosum]